MPVSHTPRLNTRLLCWSAAAAVLLLSAGCAATRLHESVQLARQSEPLQRPLTEPRARLLIVGDSTAVGTGASGPEASVAGLLAQAYPGLLIENRARDGATFAEVPHQLGASADRFDAVLVLAGGNDVIRLRDLDTLPDHLARIATLARARADTLVLMPAGNVGNAPFFFPPLSWWMSSRSRELHAMVREAAARHGAAYVSLYKDKHDDPFAQQKSLNASDGLHPSDAGYRLWFQELLAQSPLGQRLAAARAPGS
ncbi:MAG TPA: SGNH/GDSL hydrolase family protein [Rhizobacter sp.]